MIHIILVVIGCIIVFLVFKTAQQPSEFRVSREMAMAAAPQAVFAQVNDFRNWQAWSPWAKLDPAAKNSFEGPQAGTGAIFKWSGDNKVGEGSNTIIESRPYDLIRIKLEFIKPFQTTNTVEFTFKPQDNQTVVTWTMLGKNNFTAKLFSLFMNCDKMVGGDFEKGLAHMKEVVEKLPKQ